MYAKRKPDKYLYTFFILSILALFSFASNNSYAIYEDIKNKESILIRGPGSKQSFDQCFDIVTWNIAKGSRYSILQKEITTINNDHEIDIWALQETNITPLMTDIYNQIASDKEQVFSSTFKLSDVRTGGVATFSSVKSHHQDSIFSSKELKLFTKKTALLTIYPISDGRELAVINIHGINFTTLGPFQAHINSIFLSIRDFSGPVIFIGDFNTWNKARLRYLQNIMRLNGFFDAALLFNAGFDQRIKMPYLGKIIDYFKTPLDHIYVKDMHVKNIKVLADYKGSDHYPIILQACL